MDELIGETQILSSDLDITWYLTEGGDIQVHLPSGEFITIRAEDLSLMSAAIAQYVRVGGLY